MASVVSCYAFGPFLLDPVSRLLSRGGKRIPLTPKTFDMLLLLVEGRGDVLLKEQLMSTLWPDTFVEEANLTQHVATLRKTMGTSPEGASYIETVPKCGYRFVASVEIVQQKRSQSLGRPSLAVLPFTILSADAADSFLGLGIADTLITKLGQSRQLELRSTDAVAKYQLGSQSAAQVGVLLGVDFVLSGNVYKQHNQFRINLQLIRSSDESVLWTEQI